MPRGPKGEKRPADVIGNAVKVMRIATGEESDVAPDYGKNKADYGGITVAVHLIVTRSTGHSERGHN